MYFFEKDVRSVIFALRRHIDDSYYSKIRLKNIISQVFLPFMTKVVGKMDKYGSEYLIEAIEAFKEADQSSRLKLKSEIFSFNHLI
jgi:hypothetical protein